MSLVNGCETMCPMTCHDHFIDLRMFDGSHAHFRVWVWGLHSSHDMVQCSMTWHGIGKNYFMFSHDSHLHRTHECIELWIHMKTQLA